MSERPWCVASGTSENYWGSASLQVWPPLPRVARSDGKGKAIPHKTRCMALCKRLVGSPFLSMQVDHKAQTHR